MEDHPEESNDIRAKLDNFTYLFLSYDEPEHAEFAKASKTWTQTSKCNKNVCLQWFARVIEFGGTARISFDRENYILFPKSDWGGRNCVKAITKTYWRHPQIEEIAKNNVELVDDSNEYCSEIDEAVLDVEVSNRGKRTINYLDRY